MHAIADLRCYISCTPGRVPASAPWYSPQPRTCARTPASIDMNINQRQTANCSIDPCHLRCRQRTTSSKQRNAISLIYISPNVWCSAPSELAPRITSAIHSLSDHARGSLILYYFMGYKMIFNTWTRSITHGKHTINGYLELRQGVSWRTWGVTDFSFAQSTVL